MIDLTQQIRLLRNSRYGKAGDVPQSLDWGTRATLVHAGRAEWIVPVPQKLPEPNRHRNDKHDKGN